MVIPDSVKYEGKQIFEKVLVWKKEFLKLLSEILQVPLLVVKSMSVSAHSSVYEHHSDGNFGPI